ncbi:MAG: TonB-dependent receptor, partial [candidate division KSB1 bacterium]|nr:TonB-dependent receptor [candidate division KSB1 bacterium]
ITLDGPVSDKVSGPYTNYLRTGKADSALLAIPLKTNFLYYISPRVGVAHPISDKAKIFFNYGHMIEWPQFNQLYNIYQTVRSAGGNNYINTIGNPALKPPRTITYEVGYAQSILDMIELTAVGYYKDINGEADYITYRYVGGSFQYTTPQQTTYRDIRGIELTADMRYGRFVSGTAVFNYMVTSSGRYGYSRFEEDPSIQPTSVTQTITQPYAQPWFRTIVDLHTPMTFGPKLAGFYPLEGMNLNVIFNWRDGEKFTWNPLGIPGVMDNIKWRSYKRIDMRFTRRLPKIVGIEAELYLDIYNVFNIKNMTRPINLSYNTLPDGSIGSLRGTGNSLAWTNSGGQYWWSSEFLNYMNSLNLKENPDGSISGPDRPGDYPENWPNESTKGGKRSYIKMPGFTPYTFLEARDIWFGIRFNF